MVICAQHRGRRRQRLFDVTGHDGGRLLARALENVGLWSSRPLARRVLNNYACKHGRLWRTPRWDLRRPRRDKKEGRLVAGKTSITEDSGDAAKARFPGPCRFRPPPAMRCATTQVPHRTLNANRQLFMSDPVTYYFLPLSFAVRPFFRRARALT